jgi:diguanylate cyclase (GGDEF)-like protein
MQGRFDGTTEALRSPYPWAALASALMLTAIGWYGLERARHEQARVQFERRTETAVAAIRARMVSYEQVLRSGAALITSFKQVGREDWRLFITHLELEERFQGLDSVGFAEYVRPETLGEHVRRMRAEGYRDYDAKTPPGRHEMLVVAFNEPSVGTNARLAGFDLNSDPVRRAAADKARNSGEAAISARISLPADPRRGGLPNQGGFYMFVPVYHDVARDLPRSERRHAAAGFVFAPLRMHDLMSGILDQGLLQVLDMRVYDEPGGLAPAEMLDTRTAWRTASSQSIPAFVRIVHFPMPARSWTIHFISRPEFDAALRAERPWVVLAGGVLASVVVFLLTTALVEAWNRAQNLSMRDPLTGLYNRRYVDETMNRELSRARRGNQGVGIIVLDIDHFKKLNDTHGHDAGDHVLVRIGQMLRSATRGSDIPCRFGGEEFGVILPGADLSIARDRAESIRNTFAGMKFDFEGLELGPFTLSAGVAALAPGEADWGAVLRSADRALYAAKQAGRNRVITAAEAAA